MIYHLWKAHFNLFRIFIHHLINKTHHYLILCTRASFSSLWNNLTFHFFCPISISVGSSIPSRQKLSNLSSPFRKHFLINKNNQTFVFNKLIQQLKLVYFPELFKTGYFIEVQFHMVIGSPSIWYFPFHQFDTI